MKRRLLSLMLSALPLALAADKGDLNLGLGLYGMADKELSPASYNTSRSLGLGLGFDDCVAQLLGVDVAPGLDVQRSLIGTPKDGDVQATSIDLGLHLSLPLSPDWNPYIAGQAGYLPEAGQSGQWYGHYHGAISLGNRGYFSDIWGMDAAICYNGYSPRNIMLGELGVRLGLLWRSPSSAKAPAAKAKAALLPPPPALK
jgi:hypothetical protein